METTVVKFGGSSLADAVQFRKAAAIIRADSRRRYVVASAPGRRFPGDEKITDLLYRCCDSADAGADFEPTLTAVSERYTEIAAALEVDFPAEEDFAAIRAALQGSYSRDYVASRGEYLNARLLARFLGFNFLDAADGIFFTSDGTLDEERTYRTLSELLDASPYAVIPGFYGSMPDGSVHTFSRGGSDITGAIAARACEATLYENWTDVPGMLMADPQYVKNPRVIPEISYRELRELACMGASVMHEDAVFPVREANIPINIRSTNAPEDPGTMILPSAAGKSGAITGVAGRKGFSAIRLEKARMHATPGFCRDVLAVLEEEGIPFELLPSGIDALSLLVPTSALAEKSSRVLDALRRRARPDAAQIQDGIALIAVVGRRMSRFGETAGRILAAVCTSGATVRMLDQGFGSDTVILGVDETDYEPTLRAIYRESIHTASA